MDKIIIIGNGFDLAHGLKTSYKDFIQNYLKEVKETIIKESMYDDPLLSYHTTSNNELRHLKQQDKALSASLINTNRSFNIKSKFFKRVINNFNYGWVDIENIYFKELLSLNEDMESIYNLNKQFEYIREKLIAYLSNEQNANTIEAQEEYINLFISNTTYLDKLYFINFNYTHTLQPYVESCQELLVNMYNQDNTKKNNKDHVQIINIHGQLNSEKEEPIFGTGDEHNKDYESIKDLDKIQDILKFSKSFWYQRNNNYKILTKLLGKRHSQNRTYEKRIEVYGHSCGLSDRTLLKYIFEHDNVENIKLFYHPDKEGYITQSYEVWRHFSDANNYRTKLSSLEDSIPMPQISNNE